jgi:hypothetical protein
VGSRAYNKAKGAKAENDVAQAYRDDGYEEADRRPRNGKNDRGDIGGVPHTVTEVKAEVSYAGKLSGWLAEAEAERQNAAAAVGVVWHKRKGTTDPREWYVTLTGATWLKVLKGYLISKGWRQP